jgi:hypothetical protein
MADDWSQEEVAATVEHYFAMLGHELRGEAYSKREHNRLLQRFLRARSPGAIEFKHANISAVLIELGFPYIDGYKPRGNYQDRLRAEVTARLEADLTVKLAAGAVVEAAEWETPQLEREANVFVEAPSREPVKSVYERRSATPQALRRNYLEIEARNAALGAAGERFALHAEHRRLWEAGQRSLAERIEHVSSSRGDGLGYDISSFETDGRPRLIEVKTTSFGSMTPFFASAREVAVSESHAEHFHLYRVFRFRQSPKIFALQGSLRDSCILDAVAYRATLA